jgi:nucleoside-diphosphate-sugar epimerase
VRILVLGGTGFIGGPVVRRLLEEGHSVTVFHRGEAAGVAETIRGDRRELHASREAFSRFAPEVVIDTIAYTERDGENLMRTFRGLAARLVVLSSQDVYAAYGCLLRLESEARDPGLLEEGSPLRSSRYPYRGLARGPEDMAYDYEKILVERAVVGDPALPATVLRLPGVYGPGDRQHRVGEYLRRMDAGHSAIVLDGAKASWRWTRGYVEDVADAIALAASDPRAAGRTYNVGEERAPTEREWVLGIGRAAGWDGEVRAVAREGLPPEMVEPYDFGHDLVADTRRIRAELGYRERTDRDEALRQSVLWERAVGFR